MEENFIQELQELSNLETAGSLDDTQQSRLSVLKALDEAEKTATQKSKDLESAIAQKEHFRTKFEEASKGKNNLETKPKEQEPTVSTADIYALTRANVPEEDIGEVQEYAKFKGITIAEALKTSVVKTLLSEKEEQRKTAEATNVKTARRSFSKPSTDQVLEKARQGDLPDDPSELIKGEIELKRGKKAG